MNRFAIKQPELGETIALFLSPRIEWNSYNCYGAHVTQDQAVRGWWRRDCRNTAGPTSIWAAADRRRFNAIQPDTNFSNMEEMCGEIHALGSKAGLYSTPWVTSYGRRIGGHERGGRAPMELTDWIWQPDDPIQGKFGHVEGIHQGPPGGYVVRIVENVSKNGNYLHNISPKADGTIPQEQQDVLLAIGKWLGVNGEVVYFTRPCIKFGEGPVADACAASIVKLRAAGNFAGRLNGQNVAGDGVGGGGVPPNGYSPKDIHFTMRGDTFYAMLMKWPDNHRSPSPRPPRAGL